MVRAIGRITACRLSWRTICSRPLTQEPSVAHFAQCGRSLCSMLAQQEVRAAAEVWPAAARVLREFPADEGGESEQEQMNPPAPCCQSGLRCGERLSIPPRSVVSSGRGGPHRPQMGYAASGIGDEDVFMLAAHGVDLSDLDAQDRSRRVPPDARGRSEQCRHNLMRAPIQTETEDALPCAPRRQDSTPANRVDVMARRTSLGEHEGQGGNETC